MDIEILKQIGFTELQAHIYLYLIENGKQTPTKIADALTEKRTTVYAAANRLSELGVIDRKDKGKIIAFAPKHPAALESLVEKRLRIVARQTKNLENNLPSLINYYNEHQHSPGVTTFYGEAGIDHIREKILSTGQTHYFIRSHHDIDQNHEKLNIFKAQCVSANIHSEVISPIEYAPPLSATKSKTMLRTRTLLPPHEYDSSVQINIFGDNVAFIDYSQNSMSTIIESSTIADAMRQFFQFSQKYLRKATNQTELEKSINSD